MWPSRLGLPRTPPVSGDGQRGLRAGECHVGQALVVAFIDLPKGINVSVMLLAH